jgi:hypothetical protein
MHCLAERHAPQKVKKIILGARPGSPAGCFKNATETWNLEPGKLDIAVWA